MTMLLPCTIALLGWMALAYLWAWRFGWHEAARINKGGNELGTPDRATYTAVTVGGLTHRMFVYMSATPNGALVIGRRGPLAILYPEIVITQADIQQAEPTVSGTLVIFKDRVCRLHVPAKLIARLIPSSSLAHIAANTAVPRHKALEGLLAAFAVIAIATGFAVGLKLESTAHFYMALGAGIAVAVVAIILVMSILRYRAYK